MKIENYDIGNLPVLSSDLQEIALNDGNLKWGHRILSNCPSETKYHNGVTLQTIDPRTVRVIALFDDFSVYSLLSLYRHTLGALNAELVFGPWTVVIPYDTEGENSDFATDVSTMEVA